MTSADCGSRPSPPSTGSASPSTPVGCRPVCRTRCASGSPSREPWPPSRTLLLLDEPASGLSHDEIEEFADLVRGLTDQMSVLLVEHHMDLVMKVCDEITVLDFGRVIAHGTPAEVKDDPSVLSAYLGDAMEQGA